MQAILGHVEAAVARAQRAGRGELGRLRLGFTESASFNPAVSRGLVRFRARWPDVALNLAEAQSLVLAERVRSGELDGAFLRPPLPASAGFALLHLGQEALLAAVPIGHKLADRADINLSELASESFVVYPRDDGFGLSDAIVGACGRAGFAPRVAQEAPQLSSTVNFVAAALGVAIVPACMRHLRAESVAFVPLRGELPSASLAFATRADDQSLTIRNLVLTLQE